MTTQTFLVSVTLIALCSLTRAEFALFSAGISGKLIRKLEKTDHICPRDYPDGFNVECVAPSASFAEFSVNGRHFRTEMVVPFFLAGNSEDMIYPWKDHPQMARVVCTTDSGTYSVSLTFGCGGMDGMGDGMPRMGDNDDDKPKNDEGPKTDNDNMPKMDDETPKKDTTDRPKMDDEMPKKDTDDMPRMDDEKHPEGRMFFEAAGTAANRNKLRIQSGKVFCPRQEVGSEAFTITCVPPPGTSMAIFRLDGEVVQKDNKAPFYIAEDASGTPLAFKRYPRGDFEISCSYAGGMVEATKVRIECAGGSTKDRTPVEVPVPMGDPNACVIMEAKDTSLPPVQDKDGWVADQPDGVTFRPGNTDKGIAGPGEFPLTYKFTAPTTSRYGVAIDMTTRGRGDFNDIFIMFSPGGFQLMRDGNSMMADGWIKGYHSMFSRGAKISSVDYEPHSVSTGVILQKGQEYEFAIGGRSSQVTVHSIILFGCSGELCERPGWKGLQETCAPGSTDYAPRPKRDK